MDYVQLLMIGWAGWWIWTPSATPLQPTKWNACFWITFIVWWSARLVDVLKPHLPPLSSQKDKMLVFGYHVQLLMIGQAGRWTRTPSATCLQPKCWKSPFLDYVQLLSDRPGWSMDSNPIHHLSPVKKWNAHFSDYVQLLMIRPGSSVVSIWTQTPICHLSPVKKWQCLFLGIMVNFWWNRLGWFHGLYPIHHLSKAKKVTMLIFGFTFNFWWPGCAIQATKVDWNMEKVPLMSSKYEILILYLRYNFWWSAKRSEWQKLIKMRKMLFNF